ncbi:MAG: aspartate kinase [Alphaproteobacteria bacterium]|nr:aspartate kinase [Alphaproteobacteria bacterium]
MALIVQKFGGTSVANIERIRHVASLVKREVDAGNQVAVVVSAMAGATNQLVAWVNELSDLTADAALKEYDVVVSSGEQVTSGLLALALQELGIPARSWQGWQIPLRTDGAHGKARIEQIETDRLKATLKREVAIVPGFQGIGPGDLITTLGRGGSDTSAVALAAALGADRCDIYTDVDGVYTSDPRVVPKARKLKKVAYEEMLEMASLGAKVLHTRSVQMAMSHNVRVQVLSSFEDVEGSMLVEEKEVVERRLVTGITYSNDEARITLVAVPNTPGVAASIFGPLADAEVNVDMIIQNISEDGKTTDMTFTASKTDAARAVKVLEGLKAALKYRDLVMDTKVSKVSVIGVGMRTHAGIAQQMFKTLADKGINILAITTSEIKISVLIESEYVELAMRAMHTAYDLDAVEEKIAPAAPRSKKAS